jgi:hypothetical protein
MTGDDKPKTIFPTLSFTDIIAKYNTLQEHVVTQVKALASQYCQANPGKFILLQFEMSQVTQVGDSISNLIAQVNSMINSSVRNQKPQ